MSNEHSFSFTGNKLGYHGLKLPVEKYKHAHEKFRSSKLRMMLESRALRNRTTLSTLMNSMLWNMVASERVAEAEEAVVVVVEWVS